MFVPTLLLASLLPVASMGLANSKIEIIKHCDALGANLEGKRAAHQQECADRCQAQDRCRGFSFISQWNQCFLKKSIKRTSKVRIHAGNIEESPAGRTIGDIARDSDSNGKDMKQLGTAKSAEQCANACLNEVRCLSFSYIEGYSTCWLKKTRGKIRGKVFYCGRKK